MDWWSDPQQMTCNENVTEIVTFQNVTRVTVCGLLELWGALQSTIKSDGKVEFMRLIDIDDITEIPNFGEAMESVGWVIEEEQGLVFPNFSEHNVPDSERKPAMTNAERQAKYRDRKKRNGSNESNGREEKRREDIKDICRGAIDYLNEKAGKNFQHVESNYKFIEARVNEGRVFDEIKNVIDSKCAEWMGTDAAQYLRPATLFNAEKFNSYFGNLKTSPTDPYKLALAKAKELGLPEFKGAPYETPEDFIKRVEDAS